MRNFAQKEDQQQQQLYMALLDHPLACSRRQSPQKSRFSFPFSRKHNKSLPRASASLRERFFSSTYVLVGKSIDDIDHEYFVREARRSLYFFKT